eukprot:4221125-Amphidinium_carterae.1
METLTRDISISHQLKHQARLGLRLCNAYFCTVRRSTEQGRQRVEGPPVYLSTCLEPTIFHPCRHMQSNSVTNDVSTAKFLRSLGGL